MKPLAGRAALAMLITAGLLAAPAGCSKSAAAPKVHPRRASKTPLLAKSTAFAVQLTPVTVDRGQPQRRHFGPLELLAAFELTSKERRFGGLSGLELSADGKRLLSVSDRGHWFSAELTLAKDGRLLGLRRWRVGALRGLDGKPVRGRASDSEAITRGLDGAFYVSFEGKHRIWRYGKLGEIPRVVTTPAGLAKAPRNGGLESLTTLADGRILAITERLRADDDALRGWLLPPPNATATAAMKARTGPLLYATQGSFVPTDLATLPGGDVLVLERSFSILSGIRSRLRRISAAALRPGARVAAKTLLELDGRLLIDNFEGLAVQAHGGRLLLYLVADDNFSRLQRTLLYQFALQR